MTYPLDEGYYEMKRFIKGMIDKNNIKSNDNKVFNDATIELIVTIENSILKFIKTMADNQDE